MVYLWALQGTAIFCGICGCSASPLMPSLLLPSLDNMPEHCLAGRVLTLLSLVGQIDSSIEYIIYRLPISESLKF